MAPVLGVDGREHRRDAVADGRPGPDCEAAVTDGQITNRDLYEAQRDTEKQLGGLALQVATLVAELRGVCDRLDSGTTKMTDHEQRIRIIERSVPDRLGERLEELEDSAQRRRGVSTALTVIISIAASLAGSSAAAAVISYLLEHH
jgi:uncharacterized protein YPO0396